MFYIKKFDTWNTVKQKIESRLDQAPTIRPGEIRWMNFGINVGSEIDGKGDLFNRPALIIHVIGSKRALVVPLTSKIKNDPGYILFEWQRQMNTLCINQIRVVSQKRIQDRMGKISGSRLAHVRKNISDYFRF